MVNLDLKDSSENVVYGKKSFKQRLTDFWSKKRNRIIVIISAIVIILAALALGFYFLIYKNDAINLNLTKSTPTPTPQTYKSILDGTTVTTSDLANKHPLGIMVENHVDARPQFGLSQASIIYEAIAEGGITRYLAIYGPRGADKVGPVRSARTYFVDWDRELNCYLAHVGGNYDALTMIKQVGILDLDQFSNPSPYWRDYSRKVSSEHTMYTSTSKLYQLASDKNFTTANTFTPYNFKTDAAISQRPPAQTIAVNFGSVSYNVVWNYDSKSNSYLRTLAGKADVDAGNNQQLSAKNIVIQIVNRRPTVTAINEQGYIMDTVGSGDATVLEDGQQIAATWKKDNESARTRFFNKTTGAEISFNSGQTWIEILSPDLSFSVK